MCPPIVCDVLFNKYVAVAPASSTVETIPEHMVPVLLTLAVSTMKSGWEKISPESTKSESSMARENSVAFYGLHAGQLARFLVRTRLT